MTNQILSEEFRRMQLLAGVINESQLNEGWDGFSATGWQARIKDLAKEITDYLNSVIVRKDSIPTGKGTFYVVPSKIGAPFLMVMALTDKSKGFIANEEISKWLVKVDPYLVNDAQDEIMKAYIQDTKLTTGKWGGFEKLPSTLHPNDLKAKSSSPAPQAESIEQVVNEALKVYRKK